MSYNISVGTKNWNVTYNLGKLFHNNIPSVENDDGSVTDSGLQRLHLKTGAESIEILGKFFENVQADRNRLTAERHRDFHDETRGEPELCEKYDPKNGWGSLIGGLIFMGEFLAECALHSDSVIEIS